MINGRGSSRSRQFSVWFSKRNAECRMVEKRQKNQTHSTGYRFVRFFFFPRTSCPVLRPACAQIGARGPQNRNTTHPGVVFTYPVPVIRKKKNVGFTVSLHTSPKAYIFFKIIFVYLTSIIKLIKTKIVHNALK